MYLGFIDVPQSNMEVHNQMWSLFSSPQTLSYPHLLHMFQEEPELLYSMYTNEWILKYIYLGCPYKSVGFILNSETNISLRLIFLICSFPWGKIATQAAWQHQRDYKQFWSNTILYNFSCAIPKLKFLLANQSQEMTKYNALYFSLKNFSHVVI